MKKPLTVKEEIKKITKICNEYINREYIFLEQKEYNIYILEHQEEIVKSFNKLNDLLNFHDLKTCKYYILLEKHEVLEGDSLIKVVSYIPEKHFLKYPIGSMASHIATLAKKIIYHINIINKRRREIGL